MSLLFIPVVSVSMVTTFTLLLIASQKYNSRFNVTPHLIGFVQHHWINPIRALPPRILYNPKKITWIGLTAVIMMAYLTHEVVYSGFLTQWNHSLHYLMRPLRSISADAFWIKISLLNSISMFLFWGIMSLYFLLRKDMWRFIHWLALGVFVGVTTIGLKYGTAIGRPGAIFPIHDSFPSAHVSTHMTLLGGILLLADLNHKTRDLVIYGLYTLWVGLIAFSRVYFAAHWLTDIVGGALLSVISLSIISLSYFRRIAGPPLRTELGLTSLISLVGLFLIRFVSEYDAILRFYMASF